MSESIKRKLFFVLHWGLVEMREIAMHSQKHESQIYRLADILEFVPGIIFFERQRDVLALIDELKSYQRQFPTSTLCDRCLQVLESDEDVELSF